MKFKITLLAIAATFLAISGNSKGAIIYSADFSTAGVGWVHTTTNPLTPGPQSASGSNFTLSYPATPTTDGSANSYITAGGNLTASDWGGAGGFATTSIDVSSFTTVTITGVGSGTFNTPATENFIWFYSLDGGASVVSSKTTGSFNQTWTDIDVSSASNLVVGFTFNHDGGSDGFSISSVTVDAVPEPATAFLGAIGMLGLLRRRR